MVQNWLVFDLSKSSLILGLVGFVTYSPIILLSLFSGVLVDRFNKRYLLLFTQVAFMVLAFGLAILTQFNIITVNLILIISLMNGIVLSLDAPARQAVGLVQRIVDSESTDSKIETEIDRLVWQAFGLEKEI